MLVHSTEFDFFAESVIVKVIVDKGNWIIPKVFREVEQEN